MSERLLYTSSNNIYTEQICQMLDENKIPYIKRDDGIGQYSRIAMGTSTYSQNIYVDDTDFDKANNIVQIFINDVDEIETNEDDEYNAKESKKASNMRRIMALICMFLPLLVIILVAIAVIVNS